MSLRHNKKRNVGLVYEFLARYLAEAIIDNRDGDITKAKSLIRKHFNKGTDLYKELRLFRALHESTSTSREGALTLIQRVKQVVKDQSQQRLDLEKTSLIHEINAVFQDDKFFDRTIKEYKTFATIQVLLNHWRGGDSLHESIAESVQLEEKLVEHLLENKHLTKEESGLSTDDSVNGLVVNLLAEKINKKFASVFNEQQMRIVQLYAQSDHASLVPVLVTLKESALTCIDNTIASYDEPTQTKLTEARDMLTSDAYSNFSTINDELITFYMGVSKLVKEMTN